MRNKKWILVGVLILMAIVVVLREIGVIELNAYKCNQSLQVESKCSKSTYSIPQSAAKSNLGTVETGSCAFNRLKNIPIEVIYKSQSFGDKNSPKRLIIDISSSDFGMIWTPILKVSNYKVTAICKNAFASSNLDNAKFVTTKFKFDKLEISGQFKIIGFCSYQKAKSLILEHVTKLIIATANGDIK
ncbi:MAG: hypothetical protein Q8928_01115 [Bacteroidota bacterium]|nr:hypothetical protein [Bacteroidota bacterium]